MGITTTLMSIWRHLLVETRAVWKPVHWLSMRPGGLVCTCCDFSCWRVFPNGPSGSCLRRFFGVIVIFNAKFVLDLGMVRTQRSFRILGCCYYFYTKVCSQMTSIGDLHHAGTSKLISEANRWTDSCVMQFLLEGRSETMLHHWCGNGKYTAVLCFAIGRGDARVPAHFTLGVWRVSGAFSDVLSHCGIGVCFSFWYRWDYLTSRRYHSAVTV